MHVTHPSSTFQWAAYQAAIARPTPLKTRRISKHSRDAQKKNPLGWELRIANARAKIFRYP